MSTTLSLARQLGVAHEVVHDVLTETLETTSFPYGYQPPREREDERELVLPDGIVKLVTAVVGNRLNVEPQMGPRSGTERRGVTVRMTETITLFDERYDTPPFAIGYVDVEAHRPVFEGNVAWTIDKISVTGSADGPLGRATQRTFGGRGFAYTFNDVPDWLLRFAHKALEN